LNSTIFCGIVYVEERMYTMRDFFYKKNDIIVVLIILVLAGFLIYNRVGVIMDYPAQFAEQQAQAAQEAQEAKEAEEAEAETEPATEAETQPATEAETDNGN